MEQLKTSGGVLGKALKPEAPQVQSVVSLTTEQIRQLESSWMPGNIPYMTNYVEGIRRKEKLKPFLDLLADHAVVEIGPGGHPLNNFYQCGSYTGVQPHPCFVPNIGGEKYVLSDGLSYLRALSDNSAVVVSFGVLDEDVLNYGFSNSHLSERYMQELAREIRRVAYPFAIVVGNNANKYMGVPDEVPAEITQGGVYVFK